MLNSDKILMSLLLRAQLIISVLATWTVMGSDLWAIEADNKSVIEPAAPTEEKWIKLPVLIQPIEKASVRDYKGMVQETYISHQSSLKNLRIRANRSNELYFGPWRFQVDASRMDRFGGVDISVRVSHIDQKKPDSYFDLGQKLIAGKVLREGSDLRFVTQAGGRFENENSPFLADIEFGVIEESQRRLLSALEFVNSDEFKNSPIQ